MARVSPLEKELGCFSKDRKVNSFLMDFYPRTKCLLVDKIKEHSQMLAVVPNNSLRRGSSDCSAELVRVGMFSEWEVERMNRK